MGGYFRVSIYILFRERERERENMSEYLTKDLLTRLNAGSETISFFENNKLLGFPLSRLSEIEGDYYSHIKWLSNSLKLLEEGVDFSWTSDGSSLFSDQDVVYHITTEGVMEVHIDGTEIYREYDLNGNEISCRRSDGYVEYKVYDDHGRLISYKNTDGDYITKQYNEEGKLISNRNKEYTKHREYDNLGNLVYTIDSDEMEEFLEYDENQNLISYTNSKSEGYRVNTVIDNNGRLLEIEGHVKFPQW